MDPSTSLALTEKGVEEVKRRTFKLSIRKRSVLLLLEAPHSIEHLLQKTVLQADEFKIEIETLMRDGFVSIGSNPAPAMALTPTTKPETTVPQYSSDPYASLAPPRPISKPAATPAPLLSAGADDFVLLEDIILSEAKYLLVDFCVDSFGTRSQVFADEISSCRSPESFAVSLKKIHAETRAHCPDRIPALNGVVKAINETA